MDPLLKLTKIRMKREELDQEERLAVLAARTARISWAAIGEALGVTRQTAWERFSPGLPPDVAAALHEDLNVPSLANQTRKRMLDQVRYQD